MRATCADIGCVLCRSQTPERRPSFPEIVDELLVIEKELPDTTHTEVIRNLSRIYVNTY
jgi:hypothetical protein